MEEWEKAVAKAMGTRESYGHVVHENGTIEVHYYDDEIDIMLDNVIKSAMAGAGYEFTGSGYFFPKNKRDICFKRV